MQQFKSQERLETQIIYQLAPIVAKELNKQIELFPSKPMLIVVSPINSLIADQIESCCKLNLRALKLVAEEVDKVEEQNFDILYSSPENLLDKNYGNILSRLSSVIGIVIDEAHIVARW